MALTAAASRPCSVSYGCSQQPWPEGPCVVKVRTFSGRQILGLELCAVGRIGPGRRPTKRGEKAGVRVRAMAGGEEKFEDEAQSARDERRAIEALESLGRGRKSKKQDYDSDEEEEEDYYDERPKKKKSWEEMSGSEKLYEAWLGERGGLYWLNELAWVAILLIGFLWVVFRFVGPNLGLYELESPLLPPTEAF